LVIKDNKTASIDDLDLAPEQRKAVGFLAEFSQRMVCMALSEYQMPAAALDLIREVYRFTDELITGCIQKGPGLACQKGCHWCCFLWVKVTPLEVLSIHEYAYTHLTPGEISALRQRLAQTMQVAGGGVSDQTAWSHGLCPLNVDGACLVYPARPVACRCYHSLKPADCIASLEKDDSPLSIRRDLFSISIGIFAGLTQGLGAVSLKTRLLELTGGLRIAMKDPGSGLASSWLSGEPVFADAEIPNPQKTESLHRAIIEILGEELN
jgi:hypothetical protein